jgi:nucleoid-associated protein YgaU
MEGNAMKHLALVLLATLALVACNKNQNTTDPTMTAADPYEQPGYSESAYPAGAASPGALGEPTPVPAPTYVAPAAGAGQTYTVQRGDTLFSISRKFYGNHSMVNQIASVNGLTDKNRINVGQQLVLP